MFSLRQGLVLYNFSKKRIDCHLQFVDILYSKNDTGMSLTIEVNQGCPFSFFARRYASVVAEADFPTPPFSLSNPTIFAIEFLLSLVYNRTKSVVHALFFPIFSGQEK